MTTSIDLSQVTLRELNKRLHETDEGHFVVRNPRGAHALAVGITTPVTVDIEGSVGYFCAGMNMAGTVRVDGNASTGLAENIMSGVVRITGNATMSAGATGHGGLVVIEGNAGARCGISMKGVDIVVGGNVGHMSAFMAQAGNLVVLGDADHDLGDSIYEAEVFVRGKVASLGSDCVEKEMTPTHLQTLSRLLEAAALPAALPAETMSAEPSDFRLYGSARELYNFHVDDVDAAAAAKGKQ